METQQWEGENETSSKKPAWHFHAEYTWLSEFLDGCVEVFATEQY